MNWASARSSRAPRPQRTVKRDLASRAPRSKSRIPRISPSSQCGPGREVEVARRAPPADLDVLLRRRADRDRRVREIRELERQLAELRLDRAELRRRAPGSPRRPAGTPRSRPRRPHRGAWPARRSRRRGCAAPSARRRPGEARGGARPARGARRGTRGRPAPAAPPRPLPAAPAGGAGQAPLPRSPSTRARLTTRSSASTSIARTPQVLRPWEETS